MFYRLKRVYHPEFYHGPRSPRRYFEGWYYKIVSSDRSFAVIPGVSWAPSDPHCFIQTIDGISGKSSYHRYAVDRFAYGKREFSVRVADSEFTLERMVVDTESLQADLELRDLARWPTSFASPGTMGWYSYVPFMECRHGIIAMDGGARGTVDSAAGFDGRLYIEKDYGRSFPQGWIWAQTNSFEQAGVSVSCSVAKVPFLCGAFTGFLIGFLVNGALHRFTTYTGARIVRFSAGVDRAEIVVRDARRELSLVCRKEAGSVLAAPQAGEMLGRIEESLQSTVEVVFSVDGRPVFKGTGSRAGLELVNTTVLYPSR